MNTRFLFLSGFLLILTACNQSPVEDVSKESSTMVVAAGASPQSESGWVLDFVESEQGIDPYPMRLLVTKNFLRMDDGLDEGNFLLFDRVKHQIFNVVHDDKRILMIPRREFSPQQEESLQLGLQEQDASDMPQLNGQSPRHFVLTSRDKACYDIIALEGFLPEVVAALREYEEIMSEQQKVNLNKTPTEMRSDCMLANMIVAPTRYLDFGFPLRVSDYRGWSRSLTDYRQVDIDPLLFELNKSYQVFQISESGLDSAQ
jgi:hypothetical protein